MDSGEFESERKRKPGSSNTDIDSTSTDSPPSKKTPRCIDNLSPYAKGFVVDLICFALTLFTIYVLVTVSTNWDKYGPAYRDFAGKIFYELPKAILGEQKVSFLEVVAENYKTSVGDTGGGAEAISTAAEKTEGEGGWPYWVEVLIDIIDPRKW